MNDYPTTYLELCLQRLQAGDESGRDDLLNCASSRIIGLARLMLHDHARLHRWEDTGDIGQEASLRLIQALRQVTPVSLLHFYRLAALEIRRVLIDLLRHHFGPHGAAAHHKSNAAADPSTRTPLDVELSPSTWDPGKLALWTEFHKAVETLPDEQRAVFDLLWYQGLSRAQAAELLKVTVPTVRRRWIAACASLRKVLGDELPDL
jgi:RNA polymerase sigma-70 factor (ECF subfamily)